MMIAIIAAPTVLAMENVVFMVCVCFVKQNTDAGWIRKNYKPRKVGNEDKRCEHSTTLVTRFVRVISSCVEVGDIGYLSLFFIHQSP
jgi:hypothetical protein